MSFVCHIRHHWAIHFCNLCNFCKSLWTISPRNWIFNALSIHFSSNITEINGSVKSNKAKKIYSKSWILGAPLRGLKDSLLWGSFWNLWHSSACVVMRFFLLKTQYRRDRPILYNQNCILLSLVVSAVYLKVSLLTTNKLWLFR